MSKAASEAVAWVFDTLVMDTPVISSARELRDLLLSGDQLALDGLKAFIEGPGRLEGLFVDYKAAAEFQDSEKAKHTGSRAGQRHQSGRDRSGLTLAAQSLATLLPEGDATRRRSTP